MRSYEELRSEYFSALTKKSIKKSFNNKYDSHMNCKMSKLNWQGMLAGPNMGKYCLGTTDQISEIAVGDIIKHFKYYNCSPLEVST